MGSPRFGFLSGDYSANCGALGRAAAFDAGPRCVLALVQSRRYIRRPYYGQVRFRATNREQLIAIARVLVSAPGYGERRSGRSRPRCVKPSEPLTTLSSIFCRELLTILPALCQYYRATLGYSEPSDEQASRSEFDNARIQQTTQNDARRIRQRLKRRRRGAGAGRRPWAFELMQNAHDAGPRDGGEKVEIDFVLDDERLAVSHTGKPLWLKSWLRCCPKKRLQQRNLTVKRQRAFRHRISVTHALSTKVDVKGVLTTAKSSEFFHIELMRDGDEESIVNNIAQADESLRHAQEVSDAWIASHPYCVVHLSQP